MIYPAPHQVALAHAERRLTEFEGFLKSAAKGDRFTYHTGNLPKDRMARLRLGSEREEAAALDLVAARVLAASEAGLVTLSQKRVGDNIPRAGLGGKGAASGSLREPAGRWEYVAARTSRSAEPTRSGEAAQPGARAKSSGRPA